MSIAGLVGARPVRALAAVTVVALAVTWPAPAQASAPVGSIDTPSSDGSMVSTQPVAFAGHFAVPGGIMEGIDLVVSSFDGHPGARTNLPGDGLATQSFNWSAPLAYNGRYVLAATALSQDQPADGTGQLSTTLQRTFVVSVAPATPTGTVASTDASTRTVKLTWAANPEPDIYGYLIEREQTSSGSFVQIAGTGAVTSFVDRSVANQPAGPYTYGIVAVRRTGDGQGYLESSLSPTSTASISGPAGAPPTTVPPTSTTAHPGTSVQPHPAAPPAAVLSPPAKIDPGNVSSLEAEANAATATTSAADFQSRLPFNPRKTQQAINAPLTNPLAGAPALPGDGPTRRRLTLEYVAGALLLFVVAMQVLFLKNQVDQADPLERIDPRAADPTGASGALAPLQGHSED